MIKYEDVQDAFLNARFRAEDDVRAAVQSFFRDRDTREGLELFFWLPSGVQREILRRSPETAKMIQKLTGGKGVQSHGKE